jgi:hypothetical protein
MQEKRTASGAQLKGIPLKGIIKVSAVIGLAVFGYTSLWPEYK